MHLFYCFYPTSPPSILKERNYMLQFLEHWRQSDFSLNPMLSLIFHPKTDLLSVFYFVFIYWGGLNHTFWFELKFAAFRSLFLICRLVDTWVVHFDTILCQPAKPGMTSVVWQIGLLNGKILRYWSVCFDLQGLCNEQVHSNKHSHTDGQPTTTRSNVGISDLPKETLTHSRARREPKLQSSAERSTTVLPLHDCQLRN